MEETEEKAESDVEGGEKEGEDKSAQVGIYVHIKDPELQGAGLDCFDRWMESIICEGHWSTRIPGIVKIKWRK